MQSSAWPLAGRDAELALAIDLMDSGRGLVLAGAAGVGKSRLAREITQQDSSRPVRWATATASARDIPYGALLHLANEPAMPNQLVGELLALSAAEPFVLVVDDAHLLDDHSAALVLTLVQRGVSLVATIRSGESSPDAIRALWKDDHLVRIELQPLSSGESADLVQAVLDGPVAESTQRRLFHITRGNPLYVRHVLQALLAGEDLVPVSGAWVWTGNVASAGTLDELIDLELDQMQEDVREVLEFLVFAEPLEQALLEQLAGPSSIATAERLGLITIGSRRQRMLVNFAHPLYGAHTRSKMPVVRSREIRRRLADAVEATPNRRQGDDPRRALWILDSGGQPDLDLLLRAGFWARATMDLGLVERFSRAAIAAGAGFIHQLGVPYSLLWQGRFDEALGEYERLDALAENDLERGYLVNIRPNLLFFGMGRVSEARAYLDGALDAQTEPSVLLLGRAVRALFELSLGQIEVSSQTSRTVLDGWEEVAAREAAEVLTELAARAVTRPSFASDARIYATATAGYGRAAAGHLEEGREFARNVRALSMTASGPAPAIIGEWLAERCERMVGDRLASERRAREIHEFALELSFGGVMGVAALLRACADLGRGRPASALRWITDARAGLSVADLGGHMFHVATTEAVAAAHIGDADGARRGADDARRRFGPQVALFESDLVTAEAWAACVSGDQQRAVRLLRSGAHAARKAGLLAHALDIEHEALRLGDDTAAERVVDLAGRVDGPLAAARSAHGTAYLARDGAGLLEASSKFEGMGADLLALDAAAHAIGAFREASLLARAHAAAATVGRLQGQCEGAVTAATRSATLPFPLTRREQEIARLAAAGLTNREIADRLVVAVRTIEGHLDRAFAKLGVHRRDELVDVLGDR